MILRRPHVGRRARACSPQTIILQSDQTEKTRYRNGETDDIIETILAMDADSAKWVDARAAECLRGATLHETLQNVWAFVKRNTRYRADRPGHERVQSPGALFASGVGDCKSYSIAEGALLRALGIRYKYRFAAYEPGDFTHVYIVAATPEGWMPLDAVHSRPFEEVGYRKIKDIAPLPGGGIAGLGKPAPKTATNWTPIGLLAFLILILAK